MPGLKFAHMTGQHRYTWKEKADNDNPLDLAEFFDVKFYPYNPPGAPPVFAATSKRHVGKPPFNDMMAASPLSSYNQANISYISGRHMPVNTDRQRHPTL